jgi:hypothetical protein
MSNYPYLSDNRCKNCGGTILIKRSRDKNKEFCGTACVGKYLKSKNKEYVNCNFCGKKFIKTSKTKNLFCSKNCSNKNRIVFHKRICERCGKEFICHNKAEINRGRARFCSLSCSNRIYNFDENYFDFINSPNKAYILGFLYADGCISKKKTEMIIKLHNKDKCLLEKIKLEMKSEHPIKVVKQVNRDNQVKFSISSKKLCENLSAHGLLPNKTFTIEFPKIDENLVRHFVRGYFDGDGCISKVDKRKSFTVTIFTASENFMISLVDFLSKNEIETKVNKRNSGFAIYFGKKELINRFYKLIYDESDIQLDRKKEKFPICK